MKHFMDENFLLSSRTAECLYHDYAADQPIYDYHCHLPPEQIALDRRFDNLSQIWLHGDHYKWRALRSAGVEERYITGDASDFDKYMAWAKIVPQCIGNPLYHWTHLELKRPFGLTDTLLKPDTAESVWHHCNELLAEPAFSARGIMQQMKVRMVGTTDDPVDSLQHHKAIAEDRDFDIAVLPTWRPDSVFKIEQDGFPEYLRRLAEVADCDISGFLDLLDALGRRLDHFSAHGCRSADHGIETLRYAETPDAATLDAILDRRRRGETLSELETAQFATAVQVWLGKEYCRRGWVMQLHIGAQRNNSTRMLATLGSNAGFDSIGDQCFARPLAALLDAMDRENRLPKTILYCLNPRDNELLATMIGNFQGGGIPGKVQFGSGWWFNDQKDGMIRQLTSLSHMGLLSRFVGMLTDSRSFLSYTRHEYFRRILCDLLGGWVENGEAPADFQLLGKMVVDICAANAIDYFGLASAGGSGRGADNR